MFFRRVIARPDFRTLPPFPLPIYVRSVGHYRLAADYREQSGGAEPFVEIIWGIRNHGEIVINDEVLELRPGDVIWKGTHDTHGYRACSDNWELRWFTFDGPLADSFLEGYGYPRRLPEAGECPVEHFREIEQGLQAMTPYELRRLVGVAGTILAMMGRKHGGLDAAGMICERFVSLVQELYADPQINVNALADMLELHRTTLNRIFQRVMKISPGEYLANFRLQRAMTLLEEGRLPVAEIASRVGIPDPSQFARTVRRITGRTPHQIRFNPPGTAD